MGGFALAVFLGFAGYQLWHLLAPQDPNKRTRAQVGVLLVLLLLVAVGLGARALLDVRGSSVLEILASVSSGQVARLLLGLGLGAGFSYVVSHNLATRADLILIALAAAILAIISPNLDNWLSRLNVLKASVFEVQLATTQLQIVSNISHKIKIAESNEASARIETLSLLADYGQKIGQDITYIEEIELAEALAKVPDAATLVHIKSLQDYVTSARELRYVFRELISPVTECFETSVKGGLSAQRIREVLIPPAQILQQIISNQDDEDLGGNGRHEAFWRAILSAPEHIDKLRVRKDQKKCADHTKEYEKRHPDLANSKAYPRMADYKELPYLYVAAAALLRFVNETDIALAILENANSKVKQKDYRFYFLLAECANHQGRPAIVLAEPLEQVRAMAIKRQKKLSEQCGGRNACDQRKKVTLAELQKRDRLAEVAAVNNLTYHIAEDLARGIDSARGLEATAEFLASELKRIVEKNEDNFEVPALNAFKDTLAYTMMVLEAQKIRPEPQVFKAAALMLKGVLHQMEKTPQALRDRSFYVELSIVRTHYRSAIDLSSD